MQTPRELGYKMPAEWEQHQAVWLAWPHDVTTFPQGIEQAENTFCEMIKALEGSERAELLVLDLNMQKRVEGLLKSHQVNLNQVNFHQITYGDVWTRDYGPTFLTNNAWVKWQYNVYGKWDQDEIYYKPLLKDNNIFNKISLPGKKFEPGIIMEGGSIEVNGKGTLITTEQCLLNPNRNPNLSKEQIEKYLKDYLGVSKIIWLKKGLVNDHTDGHVDDIVKFSGPDTILCNYEDDEADENYSNLKENYETLKSSTDQDGKPFKVIKVPMPHMRYKEGHTVHSGQESAGDSEKAACSYMNFYIANKALLVPAYGDPNDEKAFKIILAAFPTRKLVPIDCRHIIYGGGAIHCMTQQQPA